MGTDKRARQKANRQAKIEREQAEQQVERRQGNLRRFVIIGLIVLGLILIYWFLIRDDGGGSDTPGPSVAAPPSAGATLEPGWDCPPSDGSAERSTDLLGEVPDCLDEGASYTATITTNLGAITVTLDPEQAPSAVNAFVTLARYGYYDDTAIFATDTGRGSLTGGATHTNDSSEPGPGFPIVADPAPDAGWNLGSGAVILDSNGTFEIVASGGDAGIDDTLGSVVGRVSGGQNVAQSILALHVDALETLAATDGGPSEQVQVESITIEQS